jgi:flagellar basal body rod protein FlgC
MEVIHEIVKPNTSFTRIFVKQILEDGSEIYQEFDPEDPGENRRSSSKQSYNQCKGVEIVRY